MTPRISFGAGELLVVKIGGPSKTGVLSAITAVFRDMGMDVQRAEVNSMDGMIDNTFYISGADGSKLSDTDCADLEQSLRTGEHHDLLCSLSDQRRQHRCPL